MVASSQKDPLVGQFLVGQKLFDYCVRGQQMVAVLNQGDDVDLPGIYLAYPVSHPLLAIDHLAPPASYMVYVVVVDAVQVIR